MKILSVNYALNTFARGLSNELLNIKELQKMGHHVSMVTTDVSTYFEDMRKEIGKEKYLTFLKDQPTEIFGIPVYTLHSPIPRMGVFCPDASNLAKKIIKDYDVINIRNWYNHLAIVFYKAARQHGIPYVFTAHGTLDEIARKKYRKRTKMIIDNIYTKSMIREAAALQSSGESETIEFIKLGAERQKIFRISSSGIVLKDFEIKKRTDILDRLGVDKKNKPYLLFLGRLHPKKGIELLLESFARLNHHNLALVIAGAGNESYEQKIKQLAQKLGLEKSVKFAGLVLGNEKLQLLESAKIFVLTSYSDVHPSAVVEALTMGVPVLITKNCDFPEVEEYDAGTIVEPSVESILGTLTRMIRDEKKLEIYSKNAKKVISEKFLLEFEPKKYEEMYRYAIEHNSSHL